MTNEELLEAAREFMKARGIYHAINVLPQDVADFAQSILDRETPRIKAEAVRDALEALDWYVQFYCEVQAVTPEFFNLCGDRNATEYLFSEAIVIRDKYRKEYGVDLLEGE